MSVLPLPQRPAPHPDEVLSSWLRRIAAANHCSLAELAGYLGFKIARLPETQQDLGDVARTRLGSLLGLTDPELQGMLLPMPDPFRGFVSRTDFQSCASCVTERPNIGLRHWRYAWSLRCERCGAMLHPIEAKEGAPTVSGHLLAKAARGADVLCAFVETPTRRHVQRLRLVIDFILTIRPDIAESDLTSRRFDRRLTLLAAIGQSTTRPLLKAAICVRADQLASHRLLKAAPYHRRQIERLLCLAARVRRGLCRLQTFHPAEPRQTRANELPCGKEPYLSAAREAISILGPTAPRRKLLKAASAILSDAREAEVSAMS